MRTNVHDSLGPPIEVVGAVENAKYQRVNEETFATVYLPLAQSGFRSPSVELVLRTDGDPSLTVLVVAETMRRVDPAIALGVTTSDLLTLASSALILSTTAMVAGLIPPWRAAAVDPMVALREE